MGNIISGMEDVTEKNVEEIMDTVFEKAMELVGSKSKTKSEDEEEEDDSDDDNNDDDDDEGEEEEED